MTIITLSAFALIAAAGVVATIRTVRVDGYRAVPSSRA